ncbi:MAG: RND transporter [Alphaproteobacteria bacterium]|nr:RND transporter [Alphaproteobacteria bacterium]
MNNIFDYIQSLPWFVIILACLTLGFAPFVPEPHIFEKLRMLSRGELVRPLDIFDLLFHALPFIVVAIKLGLMVRPAA